MRIQISVAAMLLSLSAVSQAAMFEPEILRFSVI